MPLVSLPYTSPMLVSTKLFSPSPIFHTQPFSQLTKGITNAKLLKWAEEPLKDEPVCMVGDAWDMLNSGWVVAAFNTADNCMSRCGVFVCMCLRMGPSARWRMGPCQLAFKLCGPRWFEAF